MNIFQRIGFYTSAYDVIVNYEVDKGGMLHIDKKGDNCRFCKLGAPQVSFKNIAHAVPEFLGNHQLILNTECDSCNKFFSRHLEAHLDSFTRHLRTVGQVKGKTKIPSYKSKDGRARFDIKPGELPKILSRQDEGHYSLDIESKTATMAFQVPPFIPSSVYKCLVKIGLSVIDKPELSQFSNTLKWINEPFFWFTHTYPNNPLLLMETYVPGPRPFRELKLMIYKKNNLVLAGFHYILLVAFGNVAYHIVLPSDNDLSIPPGKNVLVPVPVPQELKRPFGAPTLKVKDLSSDDYVRGHIESISYTFESIEPKPEYVGMSLKDLGYKSLPTST